MNDIGQRIEKKCKKLGITTAELAKNSGINYKTLNRVVRAEKPNPTMENLKLLSISLGTTIDSLVFGETTSEDEEIKILLNELKTLKKEDKSRILYMVRLMIAESKRDI